VASIGRRWWWENEKRGCESVLLGLSFQFLRTWLFMSFSYMHKPKILFLKIKKKKNQKFSIYFFTMKLLKNYTVLN
jgi:hypothetical protein